MLGDRKAVKICSTLTLVHDRARHWYYSQLEKTIGIERCPPPHITSLLLSISLFSFSSSSFSSSSLPLYCPLLSVFPFLLCDCFCFSVVCWSGRRWNNNLRFTKEKWGKKEEEEREKIKRAREETERYRKVVSDRMRMKKEGIERWNEVGERKRKKKKKEECDIRERREEK
jgi:hypothetical protein